MKVLLQRVNSASVLVEGRELGAISRGLLLLVGFGETDEHGLDLRQMAEKVVSLRVFPDEKGRFHFSVLDIAGGILAVPQFTLYADTSKGRRPDFFSALKPELAKERFDLFVDALRVAGVKEVQTGEFGAHMKVGLENDGPVTIMLES